jgi:hypothetical protein
MAMMRPLFLDRGWRLRRTAGTVLTVIACGLAVVAGFYAMKVLVGLARIVSQVCP